MKYISPLEGPSITTTPRQEAQTGDEWRARNQANGNYDPNCVGCEERKTAINPWSVFAPNHKASSGCESGKREHCTCNYCF